MTQRALVPVFSFALAVVLFPISYASAAVPPDFELQATSGSLGPDEENRTIRVASDGSGIYERYIPSAVGEPPLEQQNFSLSSAELDQLWQAVQDHDFFNLAAEHSNPAVGDRTYARLLVRANGTTHEVTTQNIAVPAFDDIVAELEALTPAGVNLEYDVSDPPSFVPRDLCDIGTSTLFQELTKREFRIILEDSNRSRELREELETPSLLLRPKSTAGSHPGTVVAHELDLQEAVDRGIVTLEGKGGFYGDQVSIDVDNSSGETTQDVKITLYLEFWGAKATQQRADEIEKAIEDAWGGRTTSDGKNVTVEVETRVRSGGSSPPGTDGYHQIQLVETGTSSVTGLGTSFDVNEGVGSGKWRTTGSQLEEMYAHEAGHLLGLPDRYQDYRKQMDDTWKRRSDGQVFTSDQLAAELNSKYPNLTVAQLKAYFERDGVTRVTPPDDPNDLMATKSGSVQQADIDSLAGQAGLLVQVRPGTILVNKDGGDQNFVVTRTTDIFVPEGDSKRLDGLYVACIDAHKGVPDLGTGFDVAPHLSEWGLNQAAPLLLELMRHVDEQELFCPSDFATQGAIWRLTDNVPPGSEASSLLENAGITVGTEDLEFPRLSNPNADDPETGLVRPAEIPQQLLEVPTLEHWAMVLFTIALLLGALHLLAWRTSG